MELIKEYLEILNNEQDEKEYDLEILTIDIITIKDCKESIRDLDYYVYCIEQSVENEFITFENDKKRVLKLMKKIQDYNNELNNVISFGMLKNNINEKVFEIWPTFLEDLKNAK